MDTPSSNALAVDQLAKCASGVGFASSDLLLVFTSLLSQTLERDSVVLNCFVPTWCYL